MKRLFAFALCAVALVLSSLVASRLVCGTSIERQTTATQTGSIETALDTPDSAFGWSYTITSLSSPVATGSANLTKRPNNNFTRHLPNLAMSFASNGSDTYAEGSATGPIRNFVAFRHHNQPRYYIFDLHRIRI